MSGGVDSSVAAYLTKQLGYDCMGVTMKLYSANEEETTIGKTCCSLEDVEDARHVAFGLDMPYYVFNFTDEFEEKVILPFVTSYQSGSTPNPCIECNRKMKFEKLSLRAKMLECDVVVTGHYARVEKQGERYILKKAVDDSKDQSYVLYMMTQDQLAHTLFPLGEMNKTQTREIAEQMQFVNAQKKDSQDICFVPDGDYAKVVEQYTGQPCETGNFIDLKGNKLGTHKGIIHYTIGQRKGLGVSASSPLYVVAIHAERNEVVLGTNEDLFKRELVAKDFNWISGEIPSRELRLSGKIRYHHAEQPCTVTVQADHTVSVVFDEPQRAITSGQSVVLYDGEQVVGGGIIL